MKWISFSRCCAASLVAFSCLFVSSCRKEGPLGFKVGQEYKYSHRFFGDYGRWENHTETREVTDVGSDWVEFESEENIFRITKGTLMATLSRYTLIE